MNTDMKQRQAAIDAAINSIEKQFGKGSIMRMNSETTTKIPTYSTGSLGLDIALGIGGLPYGRICEIY